MLIRQDVKTPSQVPNSTGWEMKKFDFHQGSELCGKYTGPLQCDDRTMNRCSDHAYSLRIPARTARSRQPGTSPGRGHCCRPRCPSSRFPAPPRDRVGRTWPSRRLCAPERRRSEVCSSRSSPCPACATARVSRYRRSVSARRHRPHSGARCKVSLRSYDGPCPWSGD